MSTLIVLSSSPPQVFARSPTPVESSSPALPSAGAILKGDSPGRKKFKSISTLRDGCAPGFSTARKILAEKGGAENIPVTSPSRYRLRSSPGRFDKVDIDNNKTKQPTLPKPISKAGRIAQPKNIEKEVEPRFGLESQPTPAPIVIQIAKKDIRKPRKRAQSPLLLPKAAARRTDWTPPKPVVAVPELDLEAESRTFPSNLLGSFGFAVPGDDVVEYQDDLDNPSKRRKLEELGPNSGKGIKSDLVPQLPQTVFPKLTSKRSKSPAKKPLTITALATSKFTDVLESEPTTLQQYLTGSQVILGDSQDAGVLDDKVSKTKAALKKLKEGKKGSKKSLLVSPSSAMRSFEEQEAIFGSASQLARDESPTFIKDTIEAMKLSESSFSHDPSSPPQVTQIASVETTPQTGTSRFRRSRNLWAAAGRDDDNALLHIDTIDLTDTPAMRNAFAGKDVLVQPGFLRSTSPARKSPVLRGGYTPLAKSKSDLCMDIDDIISPVTTPALQQQKTTSYTSARSTSPAKAQNETPSVDETSILLTDSASIAQPKPAKPKKRAPKKPNYAGFTDHELKKQISAYGFKAVKKRDKMVELLERCWDEKHGTVSEPSAVPQTETEPKGPGYGDFLSNVHDVSARPVPKVVKPKVPKRKKESDGTDPPAKKPRAPRKKKEEVLDENGVPVKKPRAPRKKKDVGEDAGTGAASKKVVRKSKAKASVSVDANTSPQDDANGEMEPTEKPTGQEALVGGVAVPGEPPNLSTATIPAQTNLLPELNGSSTSKPALVESPAPAKTVNPSQVPSPPSSPIQLQISKAIKHQSTTSRSSIQPSSRRNHQRSPTWHEKILMYDPIILEDLALWLNTEGLGAIGEDKEISAIDVRTWCEGRGICCLWKGGWRGNKGKED